MSKFKFGDCVNLKVDILDIIIDDIFFVVKVNENNTYDISNYINMDQEILEKNALSKEYKTSSGRQYMLYMGNLYCPNGIGAEEMYHTISDVEESSLSLKDLDYSVCQFLPRTVVDDFNKRRREAENVNMMPSDFHCFNDIPIKEMVEMLPDDLKDVFELFNKT